MKVCFTLLLGLCLLLPDSAEGATTAINLLGGKSTVSGAQLGYRSTLVLEFVFGTPLTLTCPSTTAPLSCVNIALSCTSLGVSRTFTAGTISASGQVSTLLFELHIGTPTNDYCDLFLPTAPQFQVQPGASLVGDSAITLPLPRPVVVYTIYPHITGINFYTGNWRTQEAVVVSDDTPHVQISVTISEELNNIQTLGLSPILYLNTGGQANFTGMEIFPNSKYFNLGRSTLYFLYVTRKGDQTPTGTNLTTAIINESFMEFFGLDFFGRWSGLHFDVSSAAPRPVSKIRILTTKPRFPPLTYDSSKTPKEAEFSDEKTQVLIETSFTDIWDLSEASQKVQYDLVYVLSWHDPRLVVDGYQQYNKPQVPSTLPIWVPEVIIWNTRGLIITLSDRIVIRPDGLVQWYKRVQFPAAWIVRPADFPYDTQAFQVIFAEGPSNIGSIQLFVNPAVEEDETEIENLYHPVWDFYNVLHNVTVYQDRKYYMFSFLGKRLGTLGTFLVLLPITLVMVGCYFSYYVPLRSPLGANRFVFLLGGLTSLTALSVTASNVQPPSAATSRIVKLVILSFTYITLCILPNTVLVSVVNACEVMAQRKAAGDMKPFFLPFYVLTFDNYKRVNEVMEHVNTGCRVVLALVFIAFITPIFVTPSHEPQQTLILGDLAFADGVDGYTPDQGRTTVAIFAAVIGVVLVLILIGFWLDVYRVKKASKQFTNSMTSIQSAS